MAIEDYYNDLTAATPHSRADDMGGTVTTLENPRTFRGFIGKPTSAQEFRAAQRGIDVKGRLYADPAADIDRYDVVTDASGATYQIHGELRDAAGRAHHVEADLVEWRWT